MVEGVERFLIKWIFFPLLRCFGKIPNHIAFILDGNRRHAVKKGLSSKFEGHVAGYGNVERVLDWCIKGLGIRMVSLYVFSMENFKRSPEEVEMLMSLLEDKLIYLSKESKMIKENDVAIRIVGELESFPPRIRKKACQAMLDTKNNKSFVINVCAPYTSRDELSHIVKDLKEANLPITPGNIDLLLYTTHTPLDILIRTSGERRLSEFLTWQVCSESAMISWVNVFWPDFTFWHFSAILLRFILRFRSSNSSFKKNNQKDERITKILKKRWDMIERWAIDPNFHQNLHFTPPNSPLEIK